MTPTRRPLDTAPSRSTQCPMLSSSSLMPSLASAARHLHAELTALHPGVPADEAQILSLVDAVTVQSVNLLVRATAPAEGQPAAGTVVVDQTGEDVLVAVQHAGRAHALSVRDLTRALIYTSPTGEHLHLALQEHLLNGDDAVDVLLRLSTTPTWNHLLSTTVTRAAQVFTLMLGGLALAAAQQVVLHDAASERVTQITFDPGLGQVVTTHQTTRHSA